MSDKLIAFLRLGFLIIAVGFSQRQWINIKWL
jgi:hypothetical protein